MIEKRQRSNFLSDLAGDLANFLNQLAMPVFSLEQREAPDA